MRAPKQTPVSLENLGDAISDLLSRGRPRRALEKIAEMVNAICEGSQTVILEESPSRVAAAVGFDDPGDRSRRLTLSRKIAAWVVESGKDTWSEDAASDPRFEDEAPPAGPFYACRLAARGENLGVMILFGVPGTRFSEDEAEWRRTGAGLAALALLQHRLRTASQRDRAARDEADRLRARAERESAAGDLAAESAEENIKTAESLRDVLSRLESESGMEERANLVRLGLEQTDRLQRLSHQVLDFHRGERRRKAPLHLNDLVEDCLLAVESDLQKKKTRLKKRMGASLPTLVLDAARMRRALTNLFCDLAQSLLPGGRLLVQTVRRGDEIELFVAADAKRIPGETLNRVWLPFTDPEMEHGFSGSSLQEFLGSVQGRLEVTQSPDWPVAYRMSLPLPVNRDRRRADRRRRSRRRAA